MNLILQNRKSCYLHKKGTRR